MKKLLISLGLVLASSTTMAEGMKFFKGSFDEALAETKKQGKVLFVDVYTDWCGPCEMMVKDVFPTDVVGDFYNANFVNYKLDAEKDEGPEVTERYPVAGYPTFWFIDGEGKLLAKIGRTEEAKKILQDSLSLYTGRRAQMKPEIEKLIGEL